MVTAFFFLGILKISIFYFAEFSMADNIHGKMGYTYPNPILLNEVSDTVILLIHSINVLSSIYYNTIPHTVLLGCTTVFGIELIFSRSFHVSKVKCWKNGCSRKHIKLKSNLLVLIFG